MTVARDDRGRLPEAAHAAAALEAAKMYYFSHLTMDAIARELHTSRPTVSRLLRFARDSGLVEVRLRTLQEAAPELEQSLAAAYGVTAHIVSVPDTATDDERRRSVAVSASEVLNSCFDSDMVLGVDWGRTLSAVSRALISKLTHNSLIVQLNGAGNSHTTGLAYTNATMRRFGHAYGARVQEFPVPAFFDSAAAKEALWKERGIRRIVDIQRRMDVVIFSVGVLRDGPPSLVYSAGYLEDPDFEELEADGAIGDVGTVFFRGDGSYDGIRLNDRASGLPLELLCLVPRRICVVSGDYKAPGIRGALLAGAVTDLVMDQSVARALLALDPQS